MPSSSCLCKIHSEFFNAFNSNLIKIWSSAKKFFEYRRVSPPSEWQDWPERVPLFTRYLPEDLQVSHLVITTMSLSPIILAVLYDQVSALAEVALQLPPCVVHELQLQRHLE